MGCREQGVVFACEGERLVGVIAGPAGGSAGTGIGVVVVVGGPQYRAGSHRQFVLLARALAGRGHHCLRFDCRGMGDGTGPARSFEQIGADIHAAIAALRAHCPAVGKVVLWGLCDGASACLLYLQAYGNLARADALCLFNPWVRSDESLAKTQVKHYYARRLMQRDFWHKLLRGGTGLTALREFLGKLGTMLRRGPGRSPNEGAYQDRMAAAWRGFPGRILLVLSGEDYTAREFMDHARSCPAWAGLLDRPGVEQHDLPGVDHTFSTASWRSQVEDLTAQWLARA